MSSILSTLQKFSLTAGLPVIIITYQPWTITSTIKYWWTKNFATHYLLLSFKVIQLNENKLRGQSPHFCRIKNEGMSPSILSYWINYKEIVDFEILFFQWFFFVKNKKVCSRRFPGKWIYPRWINLAGLFGWIIWLVILPWVD